jgi:hypothetical protein
MNHGARHLEFGMKMDHKHTCKFCIKYCEISGSHSSEYEDDRLLGCCTMWSRVEIDSVSEVLIVSIIRVITLRLHSLP